MPVGDMMPSESFSAGVLKIPFNFIPEINLDNGSEVINDQTTRFRFKIAGRSFWVRGQFDIIRKNKFYFVIF